ncbi:subtilisin family serine protease [Frigoribacterium sp. CG_9.8]|nr:subtilisin family serine protease [Frigoribacterium sp. CG_9.8]
MGYLGQPGVKGVAPGAKILFFAVGGSTPGDSPDEMMCNGDSVDASAVSTAVAGGAQIISVSLGIDSSPDLIAAIAAAKRAGVVVLGALPNETTGETGAPSGNFPAAANGVVTVQAIGADNAIEETDGKPNVFPLTKTDIAGPGIALLTQGSSDPNTREGVTIGDGTSYATPIIAGFLAMVKQKYPAATGNQLIQTLIHNTGTGTGTGNHPPARDAKGEVGYGLVSLDHMLEVNPTTDPDVNPLISTESEQTPTAQELGWSPSASSSAPARTASEVELRSWFLPAVTGGVAILVLTLLFLAVVTRRKKRAISLES